MIRITALAIICLTMASGISHAGPVCDERGKFLKLLKERYAEQPSAVGVTSDGKLMELMVSEKGTWTLILSAPSGKSCAVTAGKGWRKDIPGDMAAQFSLF